MADTLTPMSLKLIEAGGTIIARYSGLGLRRSTGLMRQCTLLAFRDTGEDPAAIVQHPIPVRLKVIHSTFDHVRAMLANENVASSTIDTIVGECLELYRNIRGVDGGKQD